MKAASPATPPRFLFFLDVEKLQQAQETELEGSLIANDKVGSFTEDIRDSLDANRYKSTHSAPSADTALLESFVTQDSPLWD